MRIRNLSIEAAGKLPVVQNRASERLSMHANDTPEELLRLARSGQSEQLGYLLAFHRDYLRLLAEVEIGRRLQSKVDASDLVQETILEAHRHFGDFRGETEGEFVAWLRQILAGEVMGLLRRYLGTQRRNIRSTRSYVRVLTVRHCSSLGALWMASARPANRRSGTSKGCYWPMPWQSCPMTTAAS